MKSVQRAVSSGFCFGVRRAVELAEKLGHDGVRAVTSTLHSSISSEGVGESIPTAQQWNKDVVGWNLGNAFECSYLLTHQFSLLPHKV